MAEMYSVYFVRIFVKLTVFILLLADYGAYGKDFTQKLSGSKDPRKVTCNDLSRDPSTRSFTVEGLDNFSEIGLDLQRNQIIVGARNHLLRLEQTELKLIEKLLYLPENLTTASCIAKGQSEVDCHNYIRVLLIHKDKLFVCGTNAFAPRCSWRKVDDLSHVSSDVSGVAKAPYSPRHNSTYIMTSDDNFYSATWTDFTSRDPAIYRMMGPSKFLRTVQYNSKWLNDPDFVSAYEIGDFVYFFFRETAVEYINCGKTIFSRVARLCKSDAGGEFLLEDNWTTFMKARLNCSLPGPYPFYFSELQSTYLVPQENVIYATFTTSPTGIYGSAVCAYNMTALDEAFSGAYKYQADPQMAWNRVSNSAPNAQCGVSKGGGDSDSNRTPAHHRLLVDAQKYQMMDSAVQPTRLQPLVFVESERFIHVVVDRLPLRGSDATLSVFFLATLEGSIRKMLVLPDSSETCLVEEISLPCLEGNTADRKKSDTRILTMKPDITRRVLYVGTTQKLYHIPVHRCSRFSNEKECIAAQDPYCGWSETLDRCAPIGHPHLTSCPITDLPVDGNWCPWSPWKPCYQIGSHLQPEVDSECLCRTRSCDCPEPKNGGKQCSGATVQVSNCSADGAWTEWSDWSACTATCGHSVRTRRRTCTNPEPRYNGKTCRGADIQTELCFTKMCPIEPLFPAVDGQWSPWSTWSPCSTRCGGGYQSRTRTCSNPKPMYGGRACTGNDQEWRACSLQQCDEVRKMSDWTPWIKSNESSTDGAVNERFRCVCRASVQDQSQLRPPQIRTIKRHCSANGEDCSSVSNTGLEIPDVDGGWSQWSAWTECDALCGTGSQHRRRLCDAPPPSGRGRDCEGHAREMRSCNTHSCVGQWSCWSEFSECSVNGYLMAARSPISGKAVLSWDSSHNSQTTNSVQSTEECGKMGRRWRRRKCEAEKPGEFYTVPCEGSEVEEVSCFTAPCSDGGGAWSEWSAWSLCNLDNMKQRSRTCLVAPSVGRHCYGPDTESRICRYNEIEEDAVIASTSMRRVGTYHAYHLAAVGVICFLIGGVVGIGVVCCWRCCGNVCCGRDNDVPTMKRKGKYKFDLLRRDVKQNSYSTPFQMSPPIAQPSPSRHTNAPLPAPPRPLEITSILDSDVPYGNSVADTGYITSSSVNGEGPGYFNTTGNPRNFGTTGNSGGVGNSNHVRNPNDIGYNNGTLGRSTGYENAMGSLLRGNANKNSALPARTPSVTKPVPGNDFNTLLYNPNRVTDASTIFRNDRLPKVQPLPPDKTPKYTPFEKPYSSSGSGLLGPNRPRRNHSLRENPKTEMENQDDDLYLYWSLPRGKNKPGRGLQTFGNGNSSGGEGSYGSRMTLGTRSPRMPTSVGIPSTGNPRMIENTTKPGNSGPVGNSSVDFPDRGNFRNPKYRDNNLNQSLVGVVPRTVPRETYPHYTLSPSREVGEILSNPRPTDSTARVQRSSSALPYRERKTSDSGILDYLPNGGPGRGYRDNGSRRRPESDRRVGSPVDHQRDLSAPVGLTYGTLPRKAPPAWLDDRKLTVGEATLKRSAVSKTGSKLRTRLDLYDNDL